MNTQNNQFPQQRNNQVPYPQQGTYQGNYAQPPVQPPHSYQNGPIAYPQGQPNNPIQQQSNNLSPQSAWPQPSNDPAADRPNPKKEKLPLGELLSRVFVGVLSVFIAVYMGWLFAPNIRNAMVFWPTHTPTPITPTPTLPATATPTPLATNTPTLAPTATPGPISTYWIPDGNVLDPAVPNAPEGLVILSVNNSAEVDPPLDSIYWTSSAQIVEDLGRMNSLYDSEWFATMSRGSARFYMDDFLKEGLYEIYVMDTFYSSGGTLDYSVKLGDQPLIPLTGTQSVLFMTSQYDPRQSMDTWRSLGIYYISPSHDLLSVSTSWDTRDPYTYVAADRVMIIPRKQSDLALLNQLPSDGTRYIMDDTQATITGASNSLFKDGSSAAWDESYQMLINPKDNVKVEYASKEPWPIGKYDLFVYIPESKGGLDAEVQLFTDDVLLFPGNNENEKKVLLHIDEGGKWVQISSYTTDRYYERPVKFKVTFQIAEEQSGEFPIDAIALIHHPFTDTL